jgi:hypothetical protein
MSMTGREGHEGLGEREEDKRRRRRRRTHQTSDEQDHKSTSKSTIPIHPHPTL